MEVVNPWSIAGAEIRSNSFNGALNMSAKHKTMGRFTPKYPELDQQILEWFTKQTDQGE